MITIEQLSFYLPYITQIHSEQQNATTILTGRMLMEKHFFKYFQVLGYKPILRPIWDLKENEAVKQIVLVEIFKETEMTYGYNTITNFGLKHTPWCVMRILLKHHFDVFDLIKQGLAIDVNTLN